ncbi:MAG: endonuclease Q family protein [archaeon]
MEIVADLHIHSKYSRACSKDINFFNLEKYAKIKGVTLLGTGDFQHPKHILDIERELEEDENGILWTKNKFPFIWQTEISLMYSQDGKGRRIHYVILAPNKDVVKQIIDALSKKGRLDYDGRPIFGFSSIEMIDMFNSISNEIEAIPAHCMTSWFGIFGSKTGFDNVEECFKEKSKYIHAIETGMSADPYMLRRVSKFDKYNLVSFSDIHSFWPWRLGREVTVFNCDLKYKNILKAIRTGEGLKKTIETFPAYGKYHYDGHRNCGVSLGYEQTRKLKEVCPKCGKELTIGVDYRIEELADRDKPKLNREYVDLIPLSELIGFVYDIKQMTSKKIWEIYNKLIKEFNTEFNILINVSEKDLLKIVDKKMIDVIMKCRNGSLNIKPGYDGVYGVIIGGDKTKVVENNDYMPFKKEQRSLSDY